MASNDNQTRSLNDDLRRYLIGGGTLVTPGIAALGVQLVEQIIEALAAFDDFQDDVAGQDHRFGAFEVAGYQVIFQISYHDKSLTSPSPDPTDPNATERIMTLMLANEHQIGLSLL